MKQMLHEVRRPSTAIAAVAFGLALTGGAVAAIPGADGSISACRDNRTGLLRAVDAEQGDPCRPSETQLSWSRRGPQGERGEPGPAGPPGERGPAGSLQTYVLPVPFTAANGNMGDCSSRSEHRTGSGVRVPAGRYAVMVDSLGGALRLGQRGSAATHIAITPSGGWPVARSYQSTDPGGRALEAPRSFVLAEDVSLRVEASAHASCDGALASVSGELLLLRLD